MDTFFFPFVLMESKGNKNSAIVGKNLNSLLQQTEITITGLANAINMSVNHLRTVMSGKATISLRTAGKITDFFEIEVSQLFSIKPIKLKNAKSISTIKKFYEENEGNQEFFISSKKKNSLMYFLRNVLLPSEFLLVEHDVNGIKIHCSDVYQRLFSSKELSAQLLRLYNEGLLLRHDKFGNGSVFMYRLP